MTADAEISSLLEQHFEMFQENRLVGKTHPVLVCEHKEDVECMYFHLQEYYADFINSHVMESCLKDCSITEFKGKLFAKEGEVEEYLKNTPILRGKNMQMAWKYIFPSKQSKVYNEYLVYDLIGIIGIIGGTFGLFIGFSFKDFILDIIDFFRGINILKNKNHF